MFQLAKARTLVHVRTAVQGLPKAGGMYVRCIASGKETMSLQEGAVGKKQNSSDIDGFGQRRLGFFEAADVLSKPPVKPKRLGFDFHLWMFILALTPSAIIYVWAQLIRRVIRQKEKELQEQEKAELLARLDALYPQGSPNQAANRPNQAADDSDQTADDPNRAPGGSKQAADGSNRAPDGSDQPKNVRSRSQRLAADRVDRKLERARAYLDESQIAALKGLSTESGGEVSGRKGGDEQGEVKNESEGEITRATGQSSAVGSSGGGTETRTPGIAEDRTENEAGTSREVRRKGKQGTGDGGASQAELVSLRAKVAELERGLKGLEDSLRQEGRELGRIAPGTALVGPRDRGESAASSRGPNNGEAGPEELTAQRGLAEERVKNVDQKEVSTDIIDGNTADRKRSFFDYVWPQWLRNTGKRDTDQSRVITVAPDPRNDRRPT